MRRRYLLLKRRRKLKEDGKKKKGRGGETVARLLKSIHARTPTKESVDTERWAHSGRLLCANCSNEKARSWAWSKGSAFEPRRKYVLDVYLKLNVLFNLVTVKFLSMALKFPPSSSTNSYAQYAKRNCWKTFIRSSSTFIFTTASIKVNKKIRLCTKQILTTRLVIVKFFPLLRKHPFTLPDNLTICKIASPPGWSRIWRHTTYF